MYKGSRDEFATYLAAAGEDHKGHYTALAEAAAGRADVAGQGERRCALCPHHTALSWASLFNASTPRCVHKGAGSRGGGE